MWTCSGHELWPSCSPEHFPSCSSAGLTTGPGQTGTARPSATTEPSSGALASPPLGHRPQLGPTGGTLTARTPRGLPGCHLISGEDIPRVGGTSHGGGHIPQQTRDLGPRPGLHVSPETQPGTPSGPSLSTCPGTRPGRRACAAEALGAPPSPPPLCRKGALLRALGALLHPASSGKPGHRCSGGVGGAMVAPRTLSPGCSRQFVSQGTPSPGPVPPKTGAPTPASPWPPGGVLKVPAA